jgi:hypothetical protein
MDCQNIYYLIFNIDFGNTKKCFLWEISTYISLLIPVLKLKGLFLNYICKEFDILAFNTTRVQNKQRPIN